MTDLLPDEIWISDKENGVGLWFENRDCFSSEATRYIRADIAARITYEKRREALGIFCQLINGDISMDEKYLPHKGEWVSTIRNSLTAPAVPQEILTPHKCRCGYRWNDFFRKDGQANCCPSCDKEARLEQLWQDKLALLDVKEG